MNPGELDFIVELDAEAPTPKALVERLVAAGLREARVGSAGAESSPRKQWVTAR